MLFPYYQTTEGETKTSWGIGLFVNNLTKVVIAYIAGATVVYSVDKIERMVAMSMLGPEKDERKELEMAEKIAYHTAKGARDGLFSWPWR